MQQRPILVNYGNCGFCRLWIERWRRATGVKVDCAPYQTAASHHPEVLREKIAGLIACFRKAATPSRGALWLMRLLL